MRVEVVRSSRRRKTVQAREVNGVVQVQIPATMSRAEERRWVGEMTRRFSRRRAAATIDLTQRAEVLAVRYGLPHPRSIRWVENQQWRWGSCTPAESAVRISSRLAAFPEWVVDYVVVHELAHLVEAGHGPRFWKLVSRYPRAERARGYLMAKGVDDEADGGDCAEPADVSGAARPVRPRSGSAGPSPAGAGLQTLW